MIENILQEIQPWTNWKVNYKKYVPKFIEEAKTKEDWKLWEKDLFDEYFEKNRDQCVASLQQGYFTNEEKAKIKNNWNEIAPLLKKVAEQQDQLNLDNYKEIKNWFRQHTVQNKKAATNRIIASLQPNLLCTIVNEDRIKVLMQRINAQDSGANLKISNNWFENSKTVLDFFKTKLNTNDAYEIITYPWQTYDYFENKHKNRTSEKLTENNNDMSDFEDFSEYIEVLKYKKQIILQGPPGTGKTRLAKQISENIILDNQLIKISDYIKINQKIPNASGVSDYYTVESVNQDAVQLSSERASKHWTASFAKILEKFQELKNNEKPKNTGGNDPYELAVAMYIFDHYKKINFGEQCKIVQFHPSYTYEDFVRGIVAESNGDKIEYKNINKTLAKFAEKALQNYQDSKKEVSLVSKEKWVDEQFSLFVEKIAEDLNNEKYFKLTDNVNIVDLEENAFLYIGSNWKGYEHRMLFKDIKQAYLDGNSVRKDLSNNMSISGSARQHATYYVLILQAFLEFVKGKSIPNDDSNKVLEKPYILIIDEINRANLSSVLGELIYALEYRGEEVESMYAVEDDNNLILPPNLYIIGTMNTADRSVGHIDYAIRRRFAFADVLPKNLKSELNDDFKEDVYTRVSKLFIKDFDVNKDYNQEKFENSEYISNDFDAKDVWLGHSYFIQHYEKDNKGEDDRDKPIDFQMRIKYEIKPILREYVKDGILHSDKIIEDKTVTKYIESL